jgi:hypothetical protein
MGVDYDSDVNKELVTFNKSFEVLKKELISYLEEIQKVPTSKNDNILQHFKTLVSSNFDKHTDQLIILNFNYTNTLEHYMPIENISPIIINIHGSLSEQVNNPVIFGYGDEMDLHFTGIERLNSNEFLKNFKSFSYFKTNNYLSMEHFLAKPFEVSIMGHSCGISDRLLLNRIFEDFNCTKIRIFYHQNGILNDYFEKTQEISRHFQATKKITMRKIIEPFPNCSPLS